MDELPLPGDVERWPQDPFELLGVKPGDDLKTVKRAYQRLIRVYRPEHYPAEFRRIREAYEAAQSITGWFTTLDPDVASKISEHADPATAGAPEPQTELGTESEHEGKSECEPAASERDDASLVDPPPTKFHRRSARTEPDESGERSYESWLAEAWRPALGGDAAAAYRELSTLRSVRPGRSEAYLALYWLLRLNAKFDAERQPCDWLAECLSATGDRSAALELYRRELVRRPSEALSNRCTTLVRSELDREGVVALIEWRWRAASAIARDPEVIVGDDLEALRKTSLSYDSGAWVRILWTVVETCCWSPRRPVQLLASRCLTELETFATAPDANYDALTQLDYMAEAAKSLNSLADVEALRLFRRLIVRSWSLPPLDLYVLLGRMIEPWLADPVGLLEFLIEIGQTAPILLGRYGQVVQMIRQELQRDLETFWTAATAESVVLDFLAEHDVKVRYDGELRQLLLEFCLYERMPPEMIAETLYTGKAFSQPHRWLPEKIAQDWPLLFTYRTIRLMTS